jgi:hypothetical protein
MTLRRPAIAAVAILAFHHHLNAFLWPLLVLTQTKSETITVGLSSLIGGSAIQYAETTASSVRGFLPLLAVFLLLQRQIVQGVANTALNSRQPAGQRDEEAAEYRRPEGAPVASPGWRPRESRVIARSCRSALMAPGASTRGRALAADRRAHLSLGHPSAWSEPTRAFADRCAVTMSAPPGAITRRPG